MEKVTHKVLVIDDDKTIRKIYKRYLGEEGFKIFEADNGQEALLKVQDQSIDIILLDIRMNVASGWVVLKALEKFYPKAKIIVSSCYPVETQKEMIRNATAYYDKSTGLSALLVKLRIVLELGSDRISKKGLRKVSKAL